MDVCRVGRRQVEGIGAGFALLDEVGSGMAGKGLGVPLLARTD